MSLGVDHAFALKMILLSSRADGSLFPEHPLYDAARDLLSDAVIPPPPLALKSTSELYKVGTFRGTFECPESRSL